MGDDGDPDKTLDVVEPHAEAPPRPLIISRDFTQLIEVERERYGPKQEIARGGMGRVFVARDLRLGRQVAIKELLPEHGDAAHRFEREARITSRLQHPAIIHIYEAGRWPSGDAFFVMPLVEGRSLAEVVAEKRTLNERLGLLPNVIAIADALAYAHNQNVIHRDLKPSNVLIGEFGETVVIDWGLAKDLGDIDPRESIAFPRSGGCEETAVGNVLGTAAYMPPEQARAEPVDQRADVYSLGALLYTVLTGTPPYQGPTAEEVRAAVIRQAPVVVSEREPGTPPDLAAIVGKAMARAPDERYASAAELAQDLKRFQTGQLVAAHHYTMRQLVVRWLRRRRLAVGIAAAAVATLAVVATISVRRIAADEANAKSLRTAVLEERGRIELLAGHGGVALANLATAADDGRIGGNRGFLIADAKRRFATTTSQHVVGDGDVVVAVSPDGQWVTAGGATWLRFPVGGGRAERLNATGRITVVAFSPDGETLLAGGENGVTLWRAGQVEQFATGMVSDAAFSPQGDRVVVASGSGAQVWNPATRRAITSKCPAAGAVRSARFNRDGTWIATTSDEGKPCVWDAETGDVITNLRGPGQAAAAVWSGDLVITGGSDGAARVWSAEAGKLVVQPLRHDQGTAIKVVRLSPDGKLVLTGGTDHVARIWALPRTPVKEGVLGAAKLVARLDGHTSAIATAAFSDDKVATGSYDGLAKVWDVATGRELATFEHGGAVTSVAFVGNQLATGSRDGITRLWTIPAAPHDPLSVQSAVHAIAVADGTIAIGPDDSVVRLYRDGQLTRLDGHNGRVLAVALAGARLVTGGEDPELLEWDAHSGAITHRLALGNPPEQVVDLAIASDGRIAAATPSSVRVFANGVLVNAYAYGHGITAVAFAPSGDIIAAAADGCIVTWPGGACHKVLSGPVNALAVSPTAIVVGGQNAAAILSADFRAIAVLDGTTDDVRSIAFTSDGQRFVTASNDGVARVWDAHTGKLLGVRGSRGAPASSLAIDGDTLWVGSEDDAGTVAAWDLAISNDREDELWRFIALLRIAVKEDE